jgi:hypothetical protein
MHPVARNIKLEIIPSFATIDDVFSYVFLTFTTSSGNSTKH